MTVRALRRRSPLPATLAALVAWVTACSEEEKPSVASAPASSVSATPEVETVKVAVAAMAEGETERWRITSNNSVDARRYRGQDFLDRIVSQREFAGEFEITALKLKAGKLHRVKLHCVDFEVVKDEHKGANMLDPVPELSGKTLVMTLGRLQKDYTDGTGQPMDKAIAESLLSFVPYSKVEVPSLLPEFLHDKAALPLGQAVPVSAEVMTKWFNGGPEDKAEAGTYELRREGQELQLVVTTKLHLKREFLKLDFDNTQTYRLDPKTSHVLSLTLRETGRVVGDTTIGGEQFGVDGNMKWQLKFQRVVADP